jgi:cobalt-zinc-cadmium efflux system membrane fusion protein
MAALSAALISLLSGCNKTSDPVETESPLTSETSADLVQIDPSAIDSFAMSTVTVQKRSLIRRLAAPAHVAFNADSIAHIASSASGRIVEIKVQVGDSVSTGDMLLVVDSPQLGEAQDDFLQKMSVARANRTRMEVALAAYDRARELYRARATALAERQKLEGEFRTVQGELNSAETAVNAGHNKLALLGMSDAATSELIATKKMTTRFVVNSPIAGKIIDRTATIGEVVGPDTEAILTVADMSTMWVIADVRESDLARIHPDDTARLSIGSAKDQALEGYVNYISPITNPQTFTGEVRIVVSNDARNLKSGMFAEAWFDLAPADPIFSRPVLAVADESVQTIEGTPCVFMPDPGTKGLFKKVPVELGEIIDGYYPVRSGLAEGDQVLTSGSFILKAELGKGSVEED